MSTLSTAKVEANPARRLWVVWLLFFLQFLAVGAFFTYLNVYYRQVGLTGTQIGLITMTSSIIGVVSAVVWGYVSDRTGKPRLLMAVGAAGAVVVVQFVPLVHTFWGFYALACLASLLTSSFGTLLDGTTLILLGSKSENYGRYRIGGSIGYILAAGASGFLYDRTGLGLIFPIYGITMGLFAATALLLPSVPVKTGTRGKAEIGLMIRQPAWLIFAVSVFLVWMANYAAMMYMGVALISMGASKSLIGVAATSGAVAELPFMAFGGWFIKRYGLVRLLLSAVVLMIIRYTLLGLMPSPEWAPPINLINGPAYGFFAISAVAYARKLAPPSLAVTSQGFLNSTMGLSGVASALTTGVLFDRTGPDGIFFFMAACCLAALVLFGAGALKARRTTPAEEVG